jgi:hypothetical protein
MGGRPGHSYGGLVTGISDLLDQARRGVARTANSILAAAYWEIGRRIVEYEQGGRERAEYGEQLLKKLARDLKARYGRGFSKRNLELMRVFYLEWEIAQTPSAQLAARVRLPALTGESRAASFIKRANHQDQLGLARPCRRQHGHRVAMLVPSIHNAR